MSPLARTTDISVFVAEYVRDLGALQQTVIALGVQFDAIPRVNDTERSSVEALREGVWHVVMRYGFIEVPDLLAGLAGLQGLPNAIDVDKTIFFSTRDLVMPVQHSFFSKWRLLLFLFRNAVRGTDRFNLPPERIFEVAMHIEL